MTNPLISNARALPPFSVRLHPSCSRAFPLQPRNSLENLCCLYAAKRNPAPRWWKRSSSIPVYIRRQSDSDRRIIFSVNNLSLYSPLSPSTPFVDYLRRPPSPLRSLSLRFRSIASTPFLWLFLSTEVFKLGFVRLCASLPVPFPLVSALRACSRCERGLNRKVFGYDSAFTSSRMLCWLALLVCWLLSVCLPRCQIPPF